MSPSAQTGDTATVHKIIIIPILCLFEHTMAMLCGLRETYIKSRILESTNAATSIHDYVYGLFVYRCSFVSLHDLSTAGVNLSLLIAQLLHNRGSRYVDAALGSLHTVLLRQAFHRHACTS